MCPPNIHDINKTKFQFQSQSQSFQLNISHLFEMLFDILMFPSSKSYLITFLFTLQFLVINSTREITVMVAQSKPFAFYENHSFKGLEIDLLENFAKRTKLKIKYHETDENLKKIFSSWQQTEQFLQSMKNS